MPGTLSCESRQLGTIDKNGGCAAVNGGVKCTCMVPHDHDWYCAHPQNGEIRRSLHPVFLSLPSFTYYFFLSDSYIQTTSHSFLDNVTMANLTRVKKPYKSWVKDGVNGGPSSMDILVGWLSDRSNYQRWRSGNAVVETDNHHQQQRIPKKILLEEILTKMRQAGIHHRLPKDVASKISTLQSNYRAACEWMNTEARRLRKAGVSEHTIHGTYAH